MVLDGISPPFLRRKGGLHTGTWLWGFAHIPPSTHPALAALAQEQDGRRGRERRGAQWRQGGAGRHQDHAAECVNPVVCCFSFLFWWPPFLSPSPSSSPWERACHGRCFPARPGGCGGMLRRRLPVTVCRQGQGEAPLLVVAQTLGSEAGWKGRRGFCSCARALPALSRVLATLPPTCQA